MRVVASDAAAALIEERGGRLYVWPKNARCCGSLMTLATASKAPARQKFRPVATSERFELLLPAQLARLPDELHLDVRRFPRRVEAYWDGAWVI